MSTDATAETTGLQRLRKYDSAAIGNSREKHVNGLAKRRQMLPDNFPHSLQFDTEVVVNQYVRPCRGSAFGESVTGFRE